MKEKKTLFSNIYVIAAIVLVVITAGLLLVSGPTKGNSPEGVLHRVERAMNKQDIKKLISYSDKDTREMAQYMNLYQLGAIFFNGGEGNDVQYHYIIVSRTDDEENENTRDDIVGLRCLCIEKNSAYDATVVRRETLYFVKENGKWYIRY